MRASDPTGLHRVLDDRVVLPQAADRLDTRQELWPDEVRIRVERLNLDAASFRQLERTHDGDGDARTPRRARHRRRPRQDAEPRDRLRRHARRHRRGGRPGVAARACAVGDRVATLVSLTLTPLVIEDGLAALGRPLRAGAVRRVRRAVRPLDRRPDPRRPARRPEPGGDGRVRRPGADRTGWSRSTSSRSVAVIGGAGKSGSLSLAAARHAGARRTVGVVPNETEAALLRGSGLADDVVVADARDPIALRDAVRRPSAGRPTSPWSASTCPAARAARSWPRRRAARSSSSRWPRRSPRRRWAPRGWRPT